MIYRSWSVAAILLLFHALAGTAAAAATMVTVNFSLTMTQHQLGDLFETDYGFVPYTTTLTLQFDPAVTERYADGGPSGYLVFAGGNRFQSPVTSSLPWSALDAQPSELERNIAVFNFEQISETEASRGGYWDDRYRRNNGIDTEYLYGISLSADPAAGALMDINPNTFDSVDLVAYLQFYMQGGWSMDFDEFGWIYDYNKHQTVIFESYSGNARITGVDARVVPAPATLWLLATGVAALGVRLRRSRGYAVIHRDPNRV